VFVREYSFTLTEHDPKKPWLVLSIDRQTVTLDENVPFYVWAREQWPEARFTVTLDPWELTS
jgi:hypothetical protein